MNLTAIISKGANGVTISLAAYFLVSCAGGGGMSGGTSDGVSTPKHGLPRHEYPFDSDGEYNEEWAKEGERRKGWGSSQSYADVDFSRSGTEEKPKKLASTRNTRSKPEKKEKTRTGFFASREKKVDPPKVKETVRTRPAPTTTRVPRERLLASNTTSSSGNSWDRSRIPQSVSTYQPPRSAPPVIQPEPRRAPRVEVAQPVAPKPTPKPVVRKPAPKPKPKPKPAPPAKRYHTVAKGDTLYNISGRYKSTVGNIKSRNRLSSDTIRLGQRLEIP
ncbi:MAG: LysM repeat protein [Verrucomicrobiales bacterium]